MKRKTKAKAMTKANFETSERAKSVDELPTDPLLRDIELDPKQLYDILEVTGDLVERAKRQPSSARKIAIMHACPGCGPDSAHSVGVPLWVESPVLMSVTCRAEHEYMLRILPPLITETTFAPRVEFYTHEAVLTEEEANAEIALHEAEAQERTAGGPIPFTPR